ncbi:hypothetical protein F5H01DRAFT_328412 [Linnemannia elongata]|nr:hypothetical protein F5H01DRAFT_328412 [Linnemannia elongata]
MRSSLRSPPYSEGGYEYHHEPSHEGYVFAENPNHQKIILLRQHHHQQQQQQKHKQQQEEEEEYWRTKAVFGVEQPQLQDLVPNGSVEEGLQEQQQQCQNRTSVCLSVAASSTTASTSTATSSLSISPRNNETPPTQHTFTGRYHRRHNPIPTATSPSFSSSHSLHPEQQIQALEIHRAVLDQTVSDENQNAILSIPSSSLLRTISPIPWNSTSPATPRWIYDIPPSYHMPVPPLPLLPISLPLLPARGAGAGAGAGSRTGSSGRAAEKQHAYHYQNSSSSSTSTSTPTTIQHTLLRL